MAQDTPTSRQALMEEAARWHARLEAGTADLAAFEAWRDADPHHAAAFARIAGVAGQFDAVRAHFPPSAEPLPDRRRNWRLSAGVAAGVILGGVAAFALLQISAPHRETSAVGVVTVAGGLPPGVHLELNTDTAATWKFEGGRRRIWIQRGEIAVTVDPKSGPVWIYGGKAEVQVADGTVNARLRNGTMDVTVLNGHARAGLSLASSSASAAPAVEIRAGQGALVEPQAVRIRALSHDDLQFISGWQDGELILNGQTLGTVVQEYNRYLTHPIVIVDPSLNDIRLGGRFATDDPKPFLAALQTGFDIHASRDSSGGIALSK